MKFQCDMCQGTGKSQILQNKDGSQVWGTTMNYDLITDNGVVVSKKDTMTITIDCSICHGTGIMPPYLAKYAHEDWFGATPIVGNNNDA